jgi:hypothetical protein
MSTLKTNRVQLGLSGTATQNFTFDASAADGTMKLARGVAGATTQDILTINALGEVDFPQLVRSYGTQGYQKLPGGLIIQWGTTGGINPGSSVSVTFPIAFPNKALSAIAGFWAAAAISAATFATNVGSGTAVSQMTVFFAGGSPQPAQWIAIGY